MNKKLIISLSTIAAIAIIAIGATVGYFSNTETSSGNTFIAGAIDLKIDNECHLNGRVCAYYGNNNGYDPGYYWNGDPTQESCDCTWGLSDLDGKAIFNFTDVKPGDDGEDTINLHVDTNPAWVCAEVSDVTQMENGCNLPESMVDDPETSCDDPGEDQGELWDNLFFSIWMDDNCDNIFQENEGPYLVENAGASNIKWPIADSQTGGSPIRNACIGVAWSVPDEVGNIIQGDSVIGDITFYAYQARHNDNFVCNPPSTGELTVNKVVVGGDADPNSFDLFVDGNSVINGVPTTQSAGNYIVTETPNPDYSLSFGDDCDSNGNVNVPSGGSATCTLTNTRNTGTITVHKVVENNGVGTKNPGNFQMTIDSNNVDQDTAIPVTTGNHTVSEADDFGYDVSFSGDCDVSGNVNVGNEEDKTCTITNTMPYGTITVTKEVVNDNGGLLTVDSFTLKIDGNTVTSGTPKNVAVGLHNVSENGVFGYSATFSGNCNASGNVTVAAGENKSCTITNNDIPPSIQLIKNVVGGSALPDDFDVSIDHVVKTSGSSNQVSANTAHVIDEEVIVSGYSFTSIVGSSFLGVPCPAALEGTITLLPGDVVTCTITNTKP